MTLVEDPRLATANAMAIKDIADQLGLHRLGRGFPEIHGPCPACGGDEKLDADRFWIDVQKNYFACRKCQVAGDVVALVRLVRGYSFLQALEWLCGPKPELTDAERDRLTQKRAKDEAATQAEADRYRARAIAAARAIWTSSLPPDATPVAAYLARRRIDVARLGGIPRSIRFHPDLRYTVEEGGGKRRVIHSGPAMVAAIQSPDGRLGGVHRTWLDLDQPKGKARIVDPVSGAVQDAKKTLGAKKGGAIRLTHTRMAATLIMAEGIETTFSAWAADPGRDAMFWVGCDMGNMAGRKQKGQGLRYAGLPDLTDDTAFLPPPGVDHLIYVMDGDSDPRTTRADMLAGCRRAMALRPGLHAQIVPVPEGFDLNDIVMGVGQ